MVFVIVLLCECLLLMVWVLVMGLVGYIDVVVVYCGVLCIFCVCGVGIC